MKLKWLWSNEWVLRCLTPLAGLCGAVSALSAGETNAPPAKAVPLPAPLTPEQMFEGGTNAYSNWIEFGAGGAVVRGNTAQFQQRRQMPGGAYGGIEDFHYQGNLDKKTTLAVDGRALFDNDDYKLNLAIEREKTGYLRFGYREFRTWSNGDGGFYPPGAENYPLSGDALALDRGELFIEGGLTLEKKPKVTFKYAHNFREGDKGSTSWGYAHPGGGATLQGLSPTIEHINERSDTFQLDVSHEIKATEFGVGIRYQTGKLDDGLRIDQYPGEAAQDKITDGQGTSYDLFNGHFSSETWLKKNLMFSSGLSYSHGEDHYSGSRIYGPDFNAGYAPNSQYGFGYLGLGGGARMNDYVVDLNLLTIPMTNLTVIPSIRIQEENWDADSSGYGTLGDAAPAPFGGQGNRDMLDVRERLDLRYNGITNWVLYARADLTEGDGNQKEIGGLTAINQIGVPPVSQNTDDTRFFQKYSAGARWYPTRRVTIDGGGYYKRDDYEYHNLTDSTANSSVSPDRYPAYLASQDVETYDANLRLTLRPWRNVTLVSRYEYQWSTIRTKPDPTSDLPEVESSTMNSHILGQDASWSPWSRLYLQAGLNYVLSTTHTPESDYTPLTPAFLAAQNDYWMVNFSSSLVLNDKTDLNLGYFYYKADNYYNNSAFGVPYGADAQEHSVRASIVYRIKKNVRLTLRYAFSHYEDVTFGGHRDYDAHVVSTGLQYRF